MKQNKIVVKGGNKLQGKVQISGAKNSSLAIIAASLLAETESIIENVPDLLDVHTMLDVVKHLGCKIEVAGSSVKITPTLTNHRAPYHLVKKMRASFYIAGPLLGRMKMAEVPLPGGCVIGTRPVNFHIKGFQTMGVDVQLEHGFMKAKTDKLHGGYIFLDPRYCSVGTTVNLMMAATLAEGTTIIENAAREPEVVDLANYLIKMGAEIRGAGTSTIEIKGVKSLVGCEHRVIPDRIEAGTFMVAGALTGGEVTVEGIPVGFVEAISTKLEEAGCEIRRDINRIKVIAQGRIQPTDVITAPFPGFPTDMQPCFVVLMCLADGISIIEETIYDGRFKYVDELRRMGANIRVNDNVAVVRGCKKLSGAPVEATDLRAGAALVLAGLVAEGETEIYEIDVIDRGYEKIEEKLSSLGADIRREHC